MSKKVAPTDEEFLVLDGINFPPDNTRRDRGQIVRASELHAKSLPWLVRDGHIVPLDGAASKPALELADEYELKLTDIDGSGKGGAVTKPDVEKYIADNKVTKPEEASNG